MKIGFRRSTESRRCQPRPGFTLVEMLVVIAIIGILVAFLIPVIASATSSAHNAAIGMEVQELSRAVEAYKNKVGDHFPDFTNFLAVTNHMSKAYPRNTRNMSTWWAATPATRAPKNLDPAEALVFWLSETRKNVRDPLGGTGDAEIYFQFDKTRLGDIDGDGWMEFYPPYGSDAPYVYFDGREISVPNPNPPPAGNVATYAYAWAIYPTPYSTTNPAPNTPVRATGVANGVPALATTPVIGVVRPYRSNTNVQSTDTKTWQATASPTEWMAPGKFQIICAGQDSHFGYAEPTNLFKTFPEMNYYTDGSDRTTDESNIANFSELKTLGDSVP